MDKIKVEKPTQEKLKQQGVDSWPIWEKEPSAFNWEYDQTEKCFILEGKAKVECADGTVEFGKGDFVQFPKGLKCKWKITEKIRKHFNFE